MSTLLDPDAAPARELAELYRQRWEIENAFDDLKTRQHAPRRVLLLRSKTPEGVQQEAYGMHLTHGATRCVMHVPAGPST